VSLTQQDRPSYPTKHKGPSPKEPSASHKHYVDGGVGSVGEGLPVIGSGLVHIPYEATEKCDMHSREGGGAIQDTIGLGGGVVAFQG